VYIINGDVCLVRVCVRVCLEGVLAERFLVLKEERGIVNNTELVRILLAKALKEGQNKNNTE